MEKLLKSQWTVIRIGVLGVAVVLAGMGSPSARAQSSNPLLGGAWGMVRSASGAPLEGIGIQVISPRTAIRTTVYTDSDGRYEFPKLDSGTYTLRVARPREFKPYQRDSVQINGSDHFEDIVLERVVNSEYLPPTPDILAQMTGWEWFSNLPGTGKEKRGFLLSCGFGCHNYQQIFKARYDEKSWRLIVRRMLRGAGSPLINLREPRPGQTARAGIDRIEEEENVIGWLSRIRGPNAQDPPMVPMPRPEGKATRVIITEYELPRTLLAPHDVHGDSKGNIWYTPHRSPYVGKLDPKTGRVEEFRVPDLPGVLPGTHRVWVDERDMVYVSENWRQNLVKLDPSTGEFQKFHFTGGTPNSPGFSNFAMDRNGFVYETLEDPNGKPSVVKIDRDTGKIVQYFNFPKKIRSTYDNIVTPDGRYWMGGETGTNNVGVLDTRSGEIWELETPTLVSAPARGGVDPDGNGWLGGRGGPLIKIDPRTRKITEYYTPFQNVSFYEIMPDKNGEIWGAPLHTGSFLRFNPKTESWTNYWMPEPHSHNRRTWIDNSTNPVTVWYVDHDGFMVRVQPLD